MENNIINVKTENISKIFKKEKFYNIPEYQRPYVWEKDNIKKLLEDFYWFYTENKDKGNKKSKEGYLLGTMMLNKVEKECKDTNMEYYCYDIIDGQQRFISLFILQALIRKMSDNEELQENIIEKLKNNGSRIDKIPKRCILQFDIRQDFEFIEQQLIDSSNNLNYKNLKTTVKNHPSLSVKNMANAACVMHDWFDKHKTQIEAQHCKFDDFLTKFYSFISNNIILIPIITTAGIEECYRLFNSFNTGGMKLKQSDILRSQNLSSITDSKTRKIYAKKFDDCIDIVESFNKKIDAFLSDICNIKIQGNRDNNVTKNILSAFKNMNGADKEDKDYLAKGTATIDLIEKYTKHFQAIKEVSLDIPENQKTIFSNLNHLTSKIDLTMPLMYFRENFGDTYIVNFFIKLDNLYSMNWLNEQIDWKPRLLKLLRKIYAIKQGGGNGLDVINCDEMKYEFDSKDAKTKISSSDFFNFLETDDFAPFKGAKINKTKYILLKLDFLMNKINTELKFEKKDCLSTEYLMPVKLHEYSHYSKSFHEKMLYKLGNLILIDGEKNNKLTDKSYAEKKEMHQTGNHHRLNANFIFKQNDQLNENVIKENHERVTALLKKYYEGNSLDTLKDLTPSEKNI